MNCLNYCIASGILYYIVIVIGVIVLILLCPESFRIIVLCPELFEMGVIENSSSDVENCINHQKTAHIYVHRYGRIDSFIKM